MDREKILMRLVFFLVVLFGFKAHYNACHLENDLHAIYLLLMAITWLLYYILCTVVSR